MRHLRRKVDLVKRYQNGHAITIWNLLEGGQTNFRIYPTPTHRNKMVAKVKSHNRTVTLIELVYKHVGSLMEYYVYSLFNLVEIPTFK